MGKTKEELSGIVPESAVLDNLKKDHDRIRQNFDKAGGADALQKIRLFLEESGERARLGLSASYYSKSDLLSPTGTAPHVSETSNRDEIGQALAIPAINSGKVLKEIRISIHFSQLPGSSRWQKAIYIEITSAGVVVNGRVLESGTTLDTAVKAILTS